MKQSQSTTIRPGYLVSLKTSINGNVSYASRDIEREHIDRDGARRAKWETERTISDPKEFEKATKVKSKARSLISGICAKSAFGLLCPSATKDKLDAAIAEAQQLVAKFNEKASLTTVSVYVITGRIAQDDAEAVRAINSEMRDLLSKMEQGVRKLDVKAIRDAADAARSVGAMLTPDASARLQRAIDVARSAARKIVKAGETAATEVDRSVIRTIRASRTAFLDLDDAGEIAAPVTTGRAIDLESAPATLAKPKSTARQFELGD
jgi:hypothetical protein